MHSPGRLIPEVDYYQGSRYRLENRFISPHDVKELGNALATNSVRALSLQGVTLDDQSFRRICSSIGVCRSLCSLNLSDQVVSTTERVEAFSDCLNINRGLTALFLQGTPIDSQNMALLVRAIKLHPNIRTLDLTNCSLDNSSLRLVTSLLPSEKGRDALEDLSIGSNPDITPEGWQHFAMAVADNSCLRSLQLYFNNVGDHAACLLIVAISASKSMLSLDLENTNIGDKTAEILLQLISDFPNHLRDVNLSGNQMSKDLLMKIKNKMSIHQAFQGGPQNVFGSSNSSKTSEGPSAPYYIPSQGFFNRPQTVPEDAEEDDSEDFETPRENPDFAAARNTLRDKIQRRQELEILDGLTDRNVESERNSREATPEKPLSPPPTSRRIGTALPGNRGQPPREQDHLDVVVDGVESPEENSFASPNGSPGQQSPFSDIIVSDGAAMLDFLQTQNSQNVIVSPYPTSPRIEEVPVSRGSSLKLAEEEEFPNKEKLEVPEPGEESEEVQKTSQSSARTYTKTPPAQLTPKEKTKSPVPEKTRTPVSGSRGSQKPESKQSQRNSPGMKTETIPRYDIKNPPDSSRLQVSKSLSFEKSLKGKTKPKFTKSATDYSIRENPTGLFAGGELKLEKSFKKESPKREESDLSNAYPSLNFGVKPESGESTKQSSSLSQQNEESSSKDPVFGVTAKAKDPRILHLQNEGRKNSSSTIASSYGDTHPTSATQGVNRTFHIEDTQLRDKGLDDVLKQNQVPVSNRMLDHGLNGEFRKSEKDLSEESIPRSLKSLLSRHNSSEKSGTEINTEDAFTENSDHYMYANRSK